jgi:hypothetical protein
MDSISYVYISWIEFIFLITLYFENTVEKIRASLEPYKNNR